MIRSTVAVAIALALLSGCTLAPRYQRPDAPVASAYPADAVDTAAAPGATPAVTLGWRQFFQAAPLQTLIERALANNRDLRVAALNVDAARAQYRIQRAQLLPAIDAVGTGNSQRTPAAVSPFGVSTLQRSYGVSAAVTSFELDVFGRVRSLRKSALEQYLALEETRTSVQLSLIAEVANAWLTLRADQQLLRLTQDTLASQRESYDLTKLRFDSGVASQIELSQVDTVLRTAEVNIAAYVRRVSQDRNALTLLVGEPLPEEIVAAAAANDDSLESLLAELPAELPSDLLQRRPDILAAEHSLQSANANIGAARAAFFPRITLTGNYGSASPDLSGLFDTGSESWTFAPRISLPIFAGGANLANLELSQVRKRIEIARYEQTIQIAFREVADALVARGSLDEQLGAQQRLVAATQRSYDLSQLRYRGGVSDYLTALIAQRDLYAAQQGLINTRLARASNLALLYKALGGGTVEASTP